MFVAPGRLRYRAFASSRVVWGYVCDLDDLGRKFTVQLWVDGVVVGLDWASRTTPSLKPREFADEHGFRLAIPPEAWGGRVREVRLANLDTSLEPLETVVEDSSDAAPWLWPGGVTWRGGLRFTGWLKPDPAGLPVQVHARIEKKLVATAPADTAAHVPGLAEAVPGFSLNLPERFANGDVHVVEIFDDSGAALEGSPIAVAAFPNGLYSLVARAGPADKEGARARVFDQLFPQSLPFYRFEDWRRRFAPAAAPLPAPVALVLVGDGDVTQTVASLASETGVNWVAASLPVGRGQTAFEASDLVECLETAADGIDTVVFTLAGAAFYPGGIGLLAAPAQQGAGIVYADFTLLNAEGRMEPVALPNFSYERLLEQGYASLLFALPRSLALDLARHGVSDLVSVFFKGWERLGGAASHIAHAPGFAAHLPRLDLPDASTRLASAAIAHLEARGVEAQASPSSGAVLLPAVRVRRTGKRFRASVIVPTRDRRDLLQPCIETIAEALDATQAELIVVDNGSSDPKTLTYLEALSKAGLHVLRDEGPFNYSRLNNRAAQIASGEALVLLNNDIEALDADWLDELLGRLSEPDVGAVGAMLLWPSRVVQHGGVTLGLRNRADHAFTDCIEGAPGYADLLCVAREVSAVTGACLATRRSHYLEVGGLDEIHFPVNFNDVDYCLKQIERGRRVVFTPHARVLHRESASRGADMAPDKAGRLSGELRQLSARWPQILANDPFYSPLLALDGTPYTGLAWPPRSIG